MPTKIATFVLILFVWTVICFASRYVVGDGIALTAMVLGEIAWFAVVFAKFVGSED